MTRLSLVPNTGIQFRELDLHASELQFVYRRFLEEEVTLSGRRTHVLHALELDGTTLFHPVTGRPLKLESTTFMSGQQGLAPFLGVWLPVPFLRVAAEQRTAGESRPGVEPGPSNWVRAMVTRKAGARDVPAGLTVVLAFDTAVAGTAPPHSRLDVAPTADDVALHSSFRLCDRAEDVAQFLSEPWVDEWLSRQLAQHRAASDKAGEASVGSVLQLEHVARYLTYLSVLARACGPLHASFVDTLTRDAPPVDVDLILDIGNSRTAGVLVEIAGATAKESSEPAVSPLQLRDLSRPWLVHSSPVESRLEFNKPGFGDEALSRRSGRSTAFLWPSLVRIGKEAAWLASRPSAREGSTGLASAKRYFTDLTSSEEPWRFVSSPEAEGSGPVVSGPLLAHIDERGELLGREGGAMPAVRPRFSRSALFGFFVAELIVQALGQINVPRATRSTDAPQRPRRLRRVVLTMPFGATADERETILRRVRDAIDVVWQTSGWQDGRRGAPARPSVDIGFDEAMSAQLVFLYNEVTRKLRTAAAEYVGMKGKSRPGHGARPALRIASLDIGGGSSGLTILTYAQKDHHLVAPSLSCAARVRHGGDDVLLAVISRLVAPALVAALSSRGLKDADEFVHDALGVAVGGIEPDDRFARSFLAQYAQPIGLVILKDHERQRLGARHCVRQTTLGELGARAEGVSAAVVAELEAHAAEMGAAGFRLATTRITIRPAVVAAAVRTALAQPLGDLLDIVDAYDCDQVLLTGWISRLPEVMDIVLERLPDRPERIVPMHEYDVASWYPFARNSGRIGDPKSTAVVGTLLGSHSADVMQGVHFRIADLSAQAARQLGAERMRLASRRASRPGSRLPGINNGSTAGRRNAALVSRGDSVISAPELIYLDAVVGHPEAAVRDEAP